MIEITTVLLGVAIGAICAGVLFTWLVTRFADTLFDIAYRHGQDSAIEAVNRYNVRNGYPQIGFTKTFQQPEPSA